ncbi:MAG TPA: ABC transporter substrate-binding protein [Chloroflexota bacterium]|nr:ABC transporter substrate-binding protein [Chloroflexota bacterium]
MRDLERLAAELRAGTIDRFDFLRAAAGLGLSAAAAAAVLDPFNALSVRAAANPNVTPAHPAKKAKYLIGFSQSELDNGWRSAETDSMLAEAKKRTSSYNYTYTVAQGDTNKQVSDVGDLIVKGCDLIVLTPRQEDPLRAATNKALAAGVPVIEIDRTSTGKAGVDFVCAIESNFVQQGEKVGNWFVANTHGPINYVELLGTTGASPAILRHQGFHNIIDKYPRFKLLGAQDGNFTVPDGKKVMQNFITRFGDKIDMIYAHNDDMGYGALEAMREAGVTKKVLIGTIDGTKRNIKLVAQGVVAIVVQSDPHFGPVTFNTIDMYFAGKKIPLEITVQDHTYTKANAARLINTGF